MTLLHRHFLAVSGRPHLTLWRSPSPGTSRRSPARPFFVQGALYWSPAAAPGRQSSLTSAAIRLPTRFSSSSVVFRSSSGGTVGSPALFEAPEGSSSQTRCLLFCGMPSHARPWTRSARWSPSNPSAAAQVFSSPSLSVLVAASSSRPPCSRGVVVVRGWLLFLRCWV